MSAQRTYRVEVSKPAQKDIGDLQKSDQRRVVAALDALAIEPRPKGCLKLQGTTDIWRIRVGDYRIIYTVDDGKLFVLVLSVPNRREAYRR